MVDQVITKQELIDAQKDAQTLEDVVNGPPGGLIETRLGRQVYTLASVPVINTMDRGEINELIEPKADKAQVTADLSLKADKSTTYTKAETDSLVTLKADKTYVDTAVGAISTDASKQYATLALATADIANIALNTNVFVSEAVNGGYWYKATAGATSLTKSPYDPLTQAKADATTKANAAEANAINNTVSALTQQFTYGENYLATDLSGDRQLSNHKELGFFGQTTNTVTFKNMLAAISNQTVGDIEYRVYFGGKVSGGNVVNINDFNFSGVCKKFPSVASTIAQEIEFDKIITIPASTSFVIAFKHVSGAVFTNRFFSDASKPTGVPPINYLYSDTATSSWLALSKSIATFIQAAFKLYVANAATNDLSTTLRNEIEVLIDNFASAMQAPLFGYGSSYADSMLIGSNRSTLTKQVYFSDVASQVISFNKVQADVFNATSGKVNYRLYVGNQVNTSGTIPDFSDFTAEGVCKSFPKDANSLQYIELDKVLKIPNGVRFTIGFVHELNTSMDLGHFNGTTKPEALPSVGFLYGTAATPWTGTVLVGNLPTFIRTGFRLALDFSGDSSSSNTTEQELILPPKIYALKGLETNIYFKHTVDCDYSIFDYDVVCNKGGQRLRNWRLTPTIADSTGEHDFSLSCYDKKTHVMQATATAKIVIASPSSNSGVTKKVMMLGDSWTAAGVTTQTILDNAISDVMKVELVGTKGSGLNKHEGRGGWTVARYNTNDADNIFWNGATSKFDFVNYLSVTGQTTPDVVLIQLGINDVRSASNSTAVVNTFNTAKAQLDNMIASMKLANPSIKVALVPPATQGDQNAWDYSSDMTAWRAKINMFVWAREMINYFKEKEAQNIYVVGAGFGLDVDYNFPMETIPVNARNSQTETTMSDPYHAASSGYKQIGDHLFAFIKTT